MENRDEGKVCGENGMTADMKFMVPNYYKHYYKLQISILPAIGLFMTEPEQAAYAANAIGCKSVIPSHDFPKQASEAANPQAYEEFTKQFPVQNTYKKVETFMEIMEKNYPHIKTIYIPIGGTAEIG